MIDDPGTQAQAQRVDDLTHRISASERLLSRTNRVNNLKYILLRIVEFLGLLR